MVFLIILDGYQMEYKFFCENKSSISLLATPIFLHLILKYWLNVIQLFFKKQLISHSNTRTCAVDLITLLNNTRGHDRCILLCVTCLWFLTCYWHKKYWVLAYYCSITVLGWKPGLEPDQAQALWSPAWPQGLSPSLAQHITKLHKMTSTRITLTETKQLAKHVGEESNKR